VGTTLFSGLSAGAYTIFVKDNNNCVYSEPFNINNIGGVSSITNTTINETCGASNGSYDVTGVTGGTAPYTYSTDGITYVGTTLFSGLSAGAYTIFVKDNNNCVYSEPFNINNIGGVTSITNNLINETCGAANGSYDVTGVTGGTAPYTYSTDGITYVGTTLFSGLNAGAYTIFVKDNNNCVYSEPFNINNIGGVTSITNNLINETCGSANGSYDVTGVTGGTAPYTYSTDGITYVGTTLFSGLTAGAYTIFVKDNNNCVYSEPFNITNIGGVSSITNTTINETCGSANGSYDVIGVTGGTAPYTYSTDGITYVGTTLFSGLNAGAYTIFVKDNNNCVYSEPFNINNIGGVTSITNTTINETCGSANGSYDVTGVTGGTAPYTYSTDGITYVGTTLFSGLSAGAYTIYVKDNNNCVYSEPFNINNIGGVSSITNTTINETCGSANGSYDVIGVTGGTAPYTYSTDGITYVGTTLFSGLNAGAYTIFVKDNNNCVYSEPFNINNVGGVTSITNTTINETCGASNGSYDVTGVTGGTAPYTYSTDGITYVGTTLFSGLSSGAYTIFVKDNNNCVYSEPFNINNIGGVTSITNNAVDASCGASNGSYDVTGVTGGTAPYTYSTDGITYVGTTLFSGLSAGAYTIFVKDNNNCVYNEAFTINNLAGVTAITNNLIDATCGNSNGSYDVTGVTGGVAPFNYSLDGITYVGTTLFSNLSAATYTMYVQDANNCVFSEPFTINTTTIPTTSAISGNSTPICNEIGATFNVTLTPGSSYAWSVPSGSVITSGSTGPDNNSIIVDLGAINGNIDVIETNAAGCTGTIQSLAITLQGCGLAANFSVDNDTICEGASVTFTDLSTGTTGSTTYFWDFGAGAVPSTATGAGPHLITYIANGSANVSLTVTDGATSILNNPNFITINPVLSPSVTISVANSTICGPTVLDFTSNVVNGGAIPNYQWQLNGVDIINANGDTLNINTLVETDVISLNVISNETCLSVPNASSNQITINDSCDAVITTLPIALNTYCAGSNLMVNYDVVGTVNANNVFIAQMSDALGSFASPINIGQLTSVTSGSIFAIIPENTTNGSQYRIRVVSNSPAISGTDNGSDIIVHPSIFGVDFSIANLNLSVVPMEAQFVNNTPNMSQYNFIWHFGDGAQSVINNANAYYTYNYNGSYNVSLVATDNTTGCSQTFYDTLNTILCSGITTNPCNHSASINAPNIINGCAGSQINLSVNNYNPAFTYQWHKNGAAVNGGNYQTLTVNSPGFYSVTVFDTAFCPKTSNPIQVAFNLPAVSPPIITITGLVGSCGLVNATLTANGSFASYLWNTGASSNSINVTQAGVYSVIGQGALGCDAQSQPYPISSSTIPTPNICMVTVDTLTNHHLLMWEQPDTNLVDSYVIYKEIPFNSNNYQQIAIIPNDSLTEYIDVNSNAEVQTDRYRISFIDTCNGETAYSDFVRAIGLRVLPGIGVQRALSWNSYFGAAQNITSYIIYSGPNYSNMNVIATALPGAPTYIDSLPVAGLNTVYRIHTELSQSCESSRAVRNRSVSNGNGNGIVTYPEAIMKLETLKYNFNILPNPNNGNFIVNWDDNQIAPGAQIWIESMYGNRITEPELITNNNKSISINVESGVYFIRISSRAGEWVTRMVVVN
jgi:homogentisate 1,2-dioxygenase